MNAAAQRISHPFGPLFGPESRILILGSFPLTIPEKKELILSHGLALWDSIASCVITGSSDASIREVRANDLRIILDSCPIERIYCNGRKSHEMYNKYIFPTLGREAFCLPSTSPANAQWSLEKLTAAWAVLKD